MRVGVAGGYAYSHEGRWMFILCMSWFFIARLIFWGRISPAYQVMVRNLLSAFVAVELPMALITMFLVVTQSPMQLPDDPAYHVAPVLVTVFTILGALCQISTVIWLLRYRKE